MAKVKGSTYPYPSHFGSHKSMIDEEKTKALLETPGNDGNVVCVDEHGSYVTKASELDTGLVDPVRNAESRLVKLFAKKKEKDK